ncbi:MAG: hypothetical protein K2X99_00965 [Gemmatimonadaceae bacterium]|nr:hypothetical protein [Gemmatimonadaceae bacterium]
MREGDALVPTPAVHGVARLDDEAELRRSLAAPSDLSPAGLLHAAVTTHGARALCAQSGEFAAWWVAADGLTEIVCDPFGAEQLYWTRLNGRVLVGPSVEALRRSRAAAGLATTLDDDALLRFLVRGADDQLTRTPWREIARARPGAWTRVSASTVTEHPTWELPMVPPAARRATPDDLARFEHALDRAVAERCGDGDALWLSGGLDSQAIALATVHAGVRVRGLCWDFQPLVPRDDEARLAALGAAAIGVPFARLALGERVVPLAHLGAPCDLDLPIDEPDLSLQRYAHAALGARVVLNGEDGDALCHPPAWRASVAAVGWGATLRGWGAAWWATGERPYLGVWLRGGTKTMPAPAFMRAEARERAVVAPASVQPHPFRPEAADRLRAERWIELQRRSAPAVTGVNVATRFPLLDRRVIEAVFAMPPWPWTHRKELLRASLRTRLPAVIHARAKTPLRGYARAQVERWRSAPTPSMWHPWLDGWVDRAAVDAQLRTDAPFEAWRVLQLAHWLQRVAP